MQISTAFFAEDVREESGGRYTAVGIYAGDVTFARIKDAKLENSALFFVVAGMKAGSHELELSITGSKAGDDGKSGTLSIGKSDFTIEEDDTNFLSISRIKGLYLPKSGDYKIRIEVDGTLMKEIEFGVIIEDE